MKSQHVTISILAISLAALPVFSAQSPAGEALSREGGQYAQGSPPPDQPSVSTLMLPAGTLITVRVIDALSSDRNRPGDVFTTVLDQPVIAQGRVVAQRGQNVMGRVAAAQNAGRVQGVSQLAIELNELVLVDGQQMPIRTQLIQASAGTSRARDAQGVGAATGIGATIGAAAGGGAGAAIGAAAGAVAGVAGVLSTRGRSTAIYPETLLTFRLLDPVSISVGQSLQAFRPVTRDDYQGVARRNPPRYPEVYSVRPLPYYSPYYYSGWYPPLGFGGYYGYYGFGPRIYVAPRVHIGRGFYRRH